MNFDGVIFGSILVRFWSPNRAQIHTCDVCCLLIFNVFLNYVFVLKASMFALGRLFFRFVFCMDFWSMLGSIWVSIFG